MTGTPFVGRMLCRPGFHKLQKPYLWIMRDLTSWHDSYWSDCLRKCGEYRVTNAKGTITGGHGYDDGF